MPTPDDVIAEARRWLGTPFHHQGRILGRGTDCAGVIIGVGKALDIMPGFDDFLAYGHTPHAGTMEKLLDLHLVRQDGPPAPGDVLYMRFEGEPQHLAIFAGPTIIHAYSIVRRCVEHRLDRTWRARICAVFRYKGLV